MWPKSKFITKSDEPPNSDLIYIFKFLELLLFPMTAVENSGEVEKCVIHIHIRRDSSLVIKLGKVALKVNFALENFSLSKWNM